MRAKFSPEQVESIRAATAAAEADTSGEIVTVVVERCDDYEEAVWKAAALGALAGALAALVWDLATGAWGVPAWARLALPTFAGAALGLAAVLAVPALRRLLVRDEALQERVERRAQAAFLEAEVFDTRDRTGILILLALFERRVVVLGDAGINARVPRERWQGIVDDLAAGIRGGRAAEAVVEAIGACGELLARHRVEPRPDDVNELPDEPRFFDA